MKHLEKLAKVLVNEGIKHGFSVGGDGPAQRTAELLSEEGMVFHQTANDAAAAMMAGACCRLGKTMALSFTSKGPGFANSFAGVVQNYFENWPAALLSEYYTESQMINRFQHISHDSVGRGIFKVDGTCDPEAREVQALMAWARVETPGPVLLQIAEEPDDSVVCLMPPEPYSSGELGGLFEMGRKAARPAVILGGPIARKVPYNHFDKVTVPIFTTAAAKGCINENSPFSAGLVGDPTDPVSADWVLRHADLIIGIGLRNTEMVRLTRFPAPLIILDIIDGTVRGTYRNGLETELEVLRPRLTDTISALLKTLDRKCWGEDLIAGRHAATLAHFGVSWGLGGAFRVIAEVSNATLVLDGGPCRSIGERLWRAEDPSRFLGMSNSHAHGNALPCAIGEALARPARPVLCVTDHAGLLPYLGELPLAIKESLPITFLVMGAGAEVAPLAAAMGMESLVVRDTAALRVQLAKTVTSPRLISVIFK